MFLHIPDGLLDALRARGWRLYTLIGGSARFMFAWDADVEAVDLLARDIAELAVAATQAADVARD